MKRTVAGVGAGVLALTGVAGAFALPANATSTFSFSRIAGQDRYETAAKIATSTFTTADNVLVASGENYPDALSGNYLAGFKAGPILLTPQAALSSFTSSALSTLQAKNVTILGGTSAVSTNVENQLKAAGYTVTRLGGTDRYETAKLISENPGAANVGTDASGKKTAILASGQNFADALTAGPLGYAKKFPVEITDPANLSAATLQTFKDLGITNVLIAGGTAAVSDNVVAQLTANGITSTRLAGNTRQLTAVAIANYERANAGFTNSHVNLANGLNYPDALAGGPHAGKELAPILLTDSPDALGAAATQYLSDNSGTLTGGNIFGGTAAVSTAAETAGNTAARGTQAASQTVLPELVSSAIVGTVTTSQATPSNPAGTTVRYTFDEPINFAAPNAGDFFVYDAAANKFTGTQASTESAGNSVTVLFPTITNATGGPQASALTTATVIPGAVTDQTGLNNPEGDAGIGAASGGTGSTALPAGVTKAPDLVSVGNFRQGSGAGDTAVDFTFDQAAFAAGTAGYSLIRQDGTVIDCVGPAAGSSGAGGGTIAGGNGTTVITVICPSPAANTPFTASQVARGDVASGTVTSTAAAGGFPNPQEAAEVTGNGVTVTPDLLTVQLRPAAAGAAAGTPDQVLYTFDQAVTLANAGSFHAYKTDGTEINGTATAINPNNTTQVLVDFAAGSLINAVGGNVDDNAVVGSGTPAPGGQTSLRDERGAAGTSSTASGQTPDRTAAPDLTGVAVSRPTDAFGNPGNYQATYTFDQPVLANGGGAPSLTAGGGSTAGSFHLYLSDGTELTATTCTVGTVTTGTARTDNQVSCTAFGAATSSTVGSATLGTVENGAVTDATTPGVTNPEGAAPVTGGTGTPTA